VQNLTNSGIYLLELYSNKKIYLTHKKFTNVIFLPGFYYYIGSAQNNLNHRISRHLKPTKKLHWHIDYLTSLKNIKWVNIFILQNHSKKYECMLANNLAIQQNISNHIKGFGNSDCSNCNSHLLYSKQKIDYSQLFSLYQFTVLTIPSSKEINCL
jgi:Uri superfamily endonuclease